MSAESEEDSKRAIATFRKTHPGAAPADLALFARENAPVIYTKKMQA